MRCTGFLLVVLLAGCAVTWTAEEKSMSLADGICASAELASQKVEIGHCAPEAD